MNSPTGGARQVDFDSDFARTGLLHIPAKPATDSA
jgi:hypothetical protein